MIICFIRMIIISISLALLNSYTPLALGFWVIMLSLRISLAVAINLFSWFGFIVFLIYVGGMLVIFSYFVAIQPNQQFEISVSLFSVFLTLFILRVVVFQGPITHSWISGLYWLRAMISFTNLSVLVLLGLVLFLALLVVVKVSSLYLGPLRPFSN